MLDFRPGPAPDLEKEAERNGHPDPDNATWGEVNILSLATMRRGGVAPSREEAEHILHVAEFDADFGR